MSASPARFVALKTVTRVREREAYAHETFDAVLGAAKLDARDTAFATRLAYGTIATRGTLDEIVGRFVRDPNRLEPAVGDALALSAYELLFMRTPDRAAVSEGVELVRAHRASAAGLANAVLRRVAEQAATFPWGDAGSDDEVLARLHGHPSWLAKLFIEQHGRAAAESMMAANNEPAPLFLAWVPTTGTFDDLMAELERDGARPSACELTGCIVADDAAAARLSGAITSRRALIVDAGAQFTVKAMRPAPGASLVEIGAGRGTKSLLLAAYAAHAGVPADVIAVDIHGHKLEALDNAASSLGISGIRSVAADAIDADLGVEDESADAVLIDAPCSGFGTLRRHPDRRWRAQPEEITALAALDAKLLERASRLVRPGGFVVYSTCTVAREENGDVVTSFLSSPAGEGFITDPLSADVPDGWKKFSTPEGWFQSLPETGGPDGHFVARLVRR